MSVPDRCFVGLVLPDPGRRRLRFLFMHDAQMRAVCWLAIGQDGSLYFNPRSTGRQPILHGDGVADGTGGFATIEWGEPASDEGGNRKVSYHASGRIKGGSRMSNSINLREIRTSTLIRQDDYAHPSCFDVVGPAALRATDVVIPGQDGQPYVLRDDCPLTSRVFVAPLHDGNAQVPIIDDDPNARAGQTAVILPATNLENCHDLTYQIQFFNRPGKWPETSTIAVINTDTPQPDVWS